MLTSALAVEFPLFLHSAAACSPSCIIVTANDLRMIESLRLGRIEKPHQGAVSLITAAVGGAVSYLSEDDERVPIPILSLVLREKLRA